MGQGLRAGGDDWPTVQRSNGYRSIVNNAVDDHFAHLVNNFYRVGGDGGDLVSQLVFTG